MAVIDKSGADDYFKKDNHVDAELWLAFKDDVRKASIAQAKRRLQKEITENDVNLDGELTDDEIGVEGDDRRLDYAVYEQALHILIHSASIPNGEATAPHWIANRMSMAQTSGVSEFDLPAKVSFFLGFRDRGLVLTRGS